MASNSTQYPPLVIEDGFVCNNLVGHLPPEWLWIMIFPIWMLYLTIFNTIVQSIRTKQPKLYGPFDGDSGLLVLVVIQILNIAAVADEANTGETDQWVRYQLFYKGLNNSGILPLLVVMLAYVDHHVQRNKRLAPRETLTESVEFFETTSEPMQDIESNNNNNNNNSDGSPADAAPAAPPPRRRRFVNIGGFKVLKQLWWMDDDNLAARTSSILSMIFIILYVPVFFTNFIPGFFLYFWIWILVGLDCAILYAVYFGLRKAMGHDFAGTKFARFLFQMLMLWQICIFINCPFNFFYFYHQGVGYQEVLKASFLEVSCVEYMKSQNGFLRIVVRLLG